MFESFAMHGSKTALITEDGSKISYDELDKRVDLFVQRFTAGRGLVLLETKNSVETIVAYVAALRHHCPVSLTDAEGHGDVGRLNETFSFLYHYHAATDELEVKADNSDTDFHPELAIMLSTSGSTGTAKSVRLSRQNVQSNTDSIVEYLKLTSDDCAPTNLPFHYSYGMSIINSHLAAGASLWVTESSVVDDGFWPAFDKHGCTSFAGVPHIYQLLEKGNFNSAERPTLRYTTQAGGKLDAEAVKRWARRSQEEGWQFFVMYGQTEASPRMAYLPPEQASTYPQCIGVPVPGGSFRIEDDDGAEITTADEPGELVYRGANVMMGYATSDKELALEPGPQELKTGDIACRNSDGLYYIVGRRSRFIKPFGLRVSLESVEAHLAKQGVTAVCGGDDKTLWILAIDHEATDALAKDTAQWLGIPITSVRARSVDEMPLNSNGKPDLRAAAALMTDSDDDSEVEEDWGDRLLKTLSSLNPWRQSADETEGSNTLSVQSAFAKTFPSQKLTPEDSFVELGGDSLSYLGMVSELEKVMGSVPDGWEKLSIRELEAMGTVGTVSDCARIDTSACFRALAITLIVAGHLGFIAYPGHGAYLLLTVAGLNFAAFQIAGIGQQSLTKAVARLLIRVMVPSMAYIFLSSLVFTQFDWRIFLLHSNFYDPHLGDGAAFWFIEVYVQLMLLIAVIFLFPGVKKAFANIPFKAAFSFAIASTLALVIGDALWDTHHLYRRVPHMMLWLFAFGIAAHFASRASHRFLVTFAFIVAMAIFAGKKMFLDITTYGFLLMLWLPSIAMPRWSIPTITHVAGASLFIYLTHFQIHSIAGKVGITEPVFSVIIAIIGGVIIWWCYEQGLNLATKMLRQVTGKNK